MDEQPKNEGDSTTTLGLGDETEVPTETASTEVASPEVTETEVAPTEPVIQEEPTTKVDEVPAATAAAIEPVSLMTDDDAKEKKKKKTMRKRKRESTNSSTSKTLNNRISKMEKELRRLTKKVDSMQKHMPRCPS